MDAVAVSMTNGMVYKDLKARHYIAMPLFFGIFQGVMPLLGFFGGQSVCRNFGQIFRHSDTRYTRYYRRQNGI